MNSRTGRVRLTVAIAAAVAALVTGCTVQGRPSVEQVDLNALDVGDYSRLPLTVPQEHNDRYGRVLESVRLGEAMADPAEADPALTFPVGFATASLLPTPAKAMSFLAEPVRAVLERNGMLPGFAVGRSDRSTDDIPPAGSARVLTIMVLRFPDTPTAQRAAQEIDAVDASVSTDNVPLSVPGYPAAHGHWRPNVPTMAATVAQDSFVVTVLAGHTTTDPAALTAMARAAFDAQLPRLREFVPTAPEKFADLPLDHDGMLARMVPQAPGRWPFPTAIFPNADENAGWSSTVRSSGVVYGPHATVLEAPARKGKQPEAIAANGLDKLLRFADVAAAREHLTRVVREDTDPVSGVPTLPSPHGLRDVHCTRLPPGGVASPIEFSCKILYGRYVATIFGRQQASILQRAVVQYAMLVNSEHGA